MGNEDLESLLARAIPRAACIFGVLLAGATFTSAATLPEGPGKAETTRVCGKCHSLDQTISLRQGRAAWQETISKMVNLGAEGSQSEVAAILNYLVKNFGSANANPAAEGAIAPTAPPERTETAMPDGARPIRNNAAPFTTGPPLPAAREWPTYGHDPGGQRYSPLTELTPENVGRLKVAWTYHMRPAGFTGSGGGFPTMEGRGPGGAVGDTPESPEGSGRGAGRGGRGGSGFRPSGDTPLVKGGIMYMATPYSRVVAVDPVTGGELWSFSLRSGNPSTRGLEFWAGDGHTPAQIVFGSSDGKLYSIDAQTGKPNPAFGDNGVVNLNTDAIMHGLPGRNSLSSPPIVYKNFVITGGTTQENPPHGPAGDVRAWDMRTGKLAWTFHSVPQKGEKFNNTWAGESWKNRSGVNVWGFLTVDEKRGIVYMPFGAPSVDQYGGDRAGDNLFSTSLVAADANTGKYLWHFQVVHHDIWDADMTGAPALIDVKRGGKTIPAVAAMDKVGMVFLLDRVTGKPIYGVEERPVPQSEVPLERTAKTQPFPIKPPPLARMIFNKADLATVTPELEAACRKLVEGVETGGPFLPPSYNHLRVQFPGNHGGVNWGGTSFDPQLGYLFANVNELGQLSGLRDHDPTSGPAMANGQGNRVDPGGPYEGVPGGGRFSIKGPTSQQLPCQQPPWGELAAVDVNTGDIAWKVSLGVTESLPEGKQNTGRPGNGGTIVTAGGLVFVGATDDARFRAFEAKTGKELWTVKLPGAAEATPITYQGRDGRQYVVITATGGGFFNNPVTGDSVIAFALDGPQQ
uniref:Quinoprotein glucose dehydrogenase n=1 Tax=Solibacter usitatus (strain Ellin6076) TaxID=234267 RepID=Q028C8_SOLUE